MQAHILSLHTPSATGVWSNGQTIFFMKFVILHIKLKGVELRAPCKHIFCPYTHPLPLGYGEKVKHLLLKVVMLHIRLKGMKQ